MNIDPDLTENIVRQSRVGCFFCRRVNYQYTLSWFFIVDTLPCDEKADICVVVSELGLLLTDMSLAVCFGFTL